MKVNRISINPNVCHGKPVIKNTRVLVSNILADLAAGQSYKEIIENYPNITTDDISSALGFGARQSCFNEAMITFDFGFILC